MVGVAVTNREAGANWRAVGNAGRTARCRPEPGLDGGQQVRGSCAVASLPKSGAQTRRTHERSTADGARLPRAFRASQERLTGLARRGRAQVARETLVEVA